MAAEYIIDKIADCLGKEYQTIWIINLDDMSMILFKEDAQNSSHSSVENALQMNNYDEIRKWYTENCVVASDQKRIYEQTELKNVIAKTEGGVPYYVEYSRSIGEEINYNQIMFARLDSPGEECRQMLIGFRDIDVRMKAERDDLTGVYTRQVFFQKAERLLIDNPGIQYDLMISDIVDFKDINETYGPATGDSILQVTGNFLATKITDDVLVGRYGGDQFVIIASHDYMCSINADTGWKEYLECNKNSNLPNITVKFGIYQGVKHNKSIISTCDKAHCALNSIKHRYGKIIAIYDDVIRHELEINRKIESSMYQALAEEQFKIYYQPKHDARSGKIVGAEALIRWIHPEYGFMSPGDFIPLFEKMDLLLRQILMCGDIQAEILDSGWIRG